MNIYLALACDKVDDSKHMSKIVRGILKEHGDLQHATIFSPAEAFTVYKAGEGERFTSFLFDINMKALSLADVLLVFYQSGTETWGVPMEVLTAHIQGKLIFVLTHDVEEALSPQFFPSYLTHLVPWDHFYTDNRSSLKHLVKKMWITYETYEAILDE